MHQIRSFHWLRYHSLELHLPADIDPIQEVYRCQQTVATHNAALHIGARVTRLPSRITYCRGTLFDQHSACHGKQTAIEESTMLAIVQGVPDKTHVSACILLSCPCAQVYVRARKPRQTGRWPSHVAHSLGGECCVMRSSIAEPCTICGGHTLSRRAFGPKGVWEHPAGHST